MWNNHKQQKKVFSFMSNLLTYYHFKLDFQKVDQHTGGKWLIHGTKPFKDNQLQSLQLPCRNPTRECKHDKKESKGNKFNPVFKKNVQGRKYPGSCAFAEPELQHIPSSPQKYVCNWSQ